MNRLKDMREDRDLTQTDIAKVLKTTYQQVYKWENGVQQMGIDKYITLAKYYNVSIDYLAGIIPQTRTLDGSPYFDIEKNKLNNEMNYYQRLKDIKDDKNLEQADIAKVLKTTQQQISRYEKGKQMMGVDKYITLAEYYNVSLDYLLGLIPRCKPLHEQQHVEQEHKELYKAFDIAPPEIKLAIKILLKIDP